MLTALGGSWVAGGTEAQTSSPTAAASHRPTGFREDRRRGLHSPATRSLPPRSRAGLSPMLRRRRQRRSRRQWGKSSASRLTRQRITKGSPHPMPTRSIPSVLLMSEASRGSFRIQTCTAGIFCSRSIPCGPSTRPRRANARSAPARRRPSRSPAPAGTERCRAVSRNRSSHRPASSLSSAGCMPMAVQRITRRFMRCNVSSSFIR